MVFSTSFVVAGRPSFWMVTLRKEKIIIGMRYTIRLENIILFVKLKFVL
jgi:hypothetical protein